MENEKLLKSIKSNLKGLVLSEKHGYTEKKLWGHYKEFIGQDLERESIKLGFPSMSALLDSFKDIIKRGFNQEGEQVYKGIADDSTRHMAELIGKTPVTKKKRKGARGRGRGMVRGVGMRGRGGFSVRGIRGTMRGGPVRGFNGRGRLSARGTSYGLLGIASNGSAMPKGDAVEWGGMGKVTVGNFPGSQRNVSFPGKPSLGGVQSYKPNIVSRSLSLRLGFKAVLQQYFDKNNLGAIPFEVSGVGSGKFTARVRVNSEEFKTSPQSFNSEDEAVEAVSKLCVNKMNIMKDGSVMKESKDKVMMVYRLEQILKGKEDGVWSSMVEKQYEKKHKEQLPSLWWEKVDVVRVEPLSEGSKLMIVYPVKEHEIQQNGEEDTNSVSSDSYGKRNGNEAVNPSIEFYEKEVEDRLFHILPELRPPRDDCWAVYITVVASTQEVYVKFIGDDYSEKFDKVSQEMDNFYDFGDIPIVEEVILEQIYAAKADGEWHRIQVTDVEDLNKVSCWFLDCGDEDVIDKKDLKELDEKFLGVPAQAFQLSLHGVKNAAENEAMIEKMNDELVGKSFIAKVIFAGDDIKVPAVILYDTSSPEEEVDMNKKIQEILDNQELFMSSDEDDYESSLSDIPEEDKSASGEDKNHFTSEVPKPVPAIFTPRVNTQAMKLAPAIFAPRVNTELPKPVQAIFTPRVNTQVLKPGPAIFNPRVNTELLKPVPAIVTPLVNNEVPKQVPEIVTPRVNTQVLKPVPAIFTPRVNEDFDVHCCLAFSPSNFIVQPLNSSDQLKGLMSALAAFYNDPSNQSAVPGYIKEGDFVAAQHENGGWYRARVVREIGQQTDLLVVRYVDYGENSIVRLDKLQPLAPEFRHLPMQAVLAKLADVHPPAGDWTKEDISWFHGRVQGEDFVSRVTGVSTGVTGETVMELVLIDTSHPEVDKYVAKELVDRK